MSAALIQKLLSIMPAPLVVAPAQAGAHSSTARALEEWIPAFAGMTMVDRTKIADLLISTLGGDEAVDLAVAEQPLPVFFDQLIVIGAARAHLWTLRAVLHHGPVRPHTGARPVEVYRNIGYEMYCAR